MAIVRPPIAFGLGPSPLTKVRFFCNNERKNNLKWRTYPICLIDENRWRAQRYAEALGCAHENKRLAHIALEGTSADRQLRAYEDAIAGGELKKAGFISVVDQLLTETAKS